MIKSLLIVSTVIGSICYSLNTKIDEQVKTISNSVFSKCKIGETIPLLGIENKSISKVLNQENEYTGYIISNIDSEKILSYYKGEFNPFDFYNNEIYFIDSVTLGNEDEYNQKYNTSYLLSETNNEISLLSNNGLNEQCFIDVPSYLYGTNITSMSQSWFLNSDYVPDYYAPSTMNNGCGPTASSMLLSFYDRNISDFNNLYNGILPLKKNNSNKSTIDNFIYNIKDFLDTNDIYGTSALSIRTGLTNFIGNRGCTPTNDMGSYCMMNLATLNDFEYSIITGHCATIINIPNHFILGFGIEVSGSDRFILSRYGWESRSGIYAINENQYQNGCCIIKGYYYGN